MHGDRPVKVILGRPHLDRDGGKLDHLTRLGPDDMAAKDAATGDVDDQFHHHSVGTPGKSAAHRAECGHIDIHRPAFGRRFLGHPDRPQFGLGEHG